MHIDPYIILGSAIIGLLVGMTGAGGGALMTPMLILLFGVTPAAAISSDLVAAVVMRPFGAAVHLRAGTVNLRLVRWMVLGSVPMAFLGPWLVHHLANDKDQLDTKPLATGTFQLEKDELTLNYTGGEMCKGNGPGVYKVVLSKIGMRFTKVSDDCEQRAKLDGQTWFRLRP